MLTAYNWLLPGIIYDFVYTAHACMNNANWKPIGRQAVIHLQFRCFNVSGSHAQAAIMNFEMQLLNNAD